MSGTYEHAQDEFRSDLRLVHGSLFDGTPCQILLEGAAVGTGSSARIRKGYLVRDDPLVVAVKVFGELLDDAKQQLLLRELHFAREVSMSHLSIVGFLGTAAVGEQTAIVSFYMENGNLMQYIKSHPGCDKKKLILQVADAVEFLHVEKKLVHGDLKCDNVLVSDFGNALLADFGLSSFIEKSDRLSTTMTAIRQMNTLQFAAPELLMGEGNTTLSKTCASDVYAFGMLVLEALSEELPWPNQGRFSVMQKICSGQHPARPTRDGVLVSFSHSWWNACLDCWKFVPRDRPLISAVLTTLRGTDPTPYRMLPGNPGISVCVYSPDGKIIVAGCYNGTIVLLDQSMGRTRHICLAGTQSSDEAKTGVAVSPNGQHIACIFDKQVLLWNSASNTVIAAMQHDSWVSCVAYSPDGRFIASGVDDRAVQVWDAVTGASVWQRLEDHSDSVNCVSFSPDGITLASGSDDGTIRFWGSTTGAELATLTPPEAYAVNSISFSPDGTHLASACTFSTVIIWDVHARRPVHILESNGEEVLSVAFSPSGKYVAAGSKANDILVWDVRDGTEIGVLSAGDKGGAASLAFSPDGRTLMSAFFFTLVYGEHGLECLCERELYVWDWFE